MSRAIALLRAESRVRVSRLPPESFPRLWEGRRPADADRRQRVTTHIAPSTLVVSQP